MAAGRILVALPFRIRVMINPASIPEDPLQNDCINQPEDTAMFRSKFLMSCLFYAVIMPNTGYSEAPAADAADPKKTQARLAPTIGNTASGTVTFTQQADGTLIKAEMTGLTQGPHGFHIHEKGDCSSGDGKSAGGHFNPNATAHGGPDDRIRHVGDLGNIKADASGNARYERLDTVVSLHGANSIVGKAVIVHAGRDDLTTQPTGAAGARVACGVIEQ